MEEYTPILRRGYSLPGCLNPRLACLYSWYSSCGSMDSHQDVASILIFHGTIYITIAEMVICILALIYWLLCSYPLLSTFFFSLEAYWLPLFLEPLGCPLVLPIFSIYCACTHASLIAN